MSTIEDFDLFLRENPGVDLTNSGTDPEIEFPGYRHVHNILPRSASNAGGSDPNNSGQNDPGGNGNDGDNDNGDNGNDGDSDNGDNGNDGDNDNGGNGNDGDNDNEGNGIDGDNDGETGELCQFDSNGNYNTDVGNLGADQNFLDYTYKVETIVGAANLEIEVLPWLERAILKSVVSEYFGCDRRILSSEWKSNSRRLDLAGASTSPPDLLSEDGEFLYVSIFNDHYTSLQDFLTPLL